MNHILEFFLKTAQEHPDRCCFLSKEEGQWKKYTWREVLLLVHKLSWALNTIGVCKGCRVAIISATRLEWTIADLAVLACGAITVPIYPTYPAQRISYMFENADVEFVFVEGEKEKETVKKAMVDFSHPPKIININTAQVDSDGFDYKALIASVDADSLPPLEVLLREIKASSMASIIYTSGTTGSPKGVVLTHGNIIAEVKATSQIFKFSSEDICLQALPLAHVLGRLIQFHHLAGAYQLAFIESFSKFAENCREVRPDFVVGVPRMLEKIQEAIDKSLEKAPSWKRRMFKVAHNFGIRRSKLMEKRRKLTLFEKWWYSVLHLLVFKKLRARLGGKLKIFICGGAPLREELARYFHALNLLVLEGYGLTETFAAATVNRPNNYRFGTVGQVVPSVELRLSAENEVLFRGPTIFREYLNQPLQTTQVKRADGWFKTGDIGELSADGFLKITDRKKEIIVTAGGQNVAPQMIENALVESRFINYCLVCGDRRKFLTALITLDEENLKEYAQRNGLGGSYSELTAHPLIYGLIASVIEEKNKRFARHETIKKFAILPRDFSQETGELTPTLKVKRKFTIEKYNSVLESLYKE